MPKIKIYEYANCDTCRKALKFLDVKKLAYEKIDITQQPPSLSELKQMLTHVGGELKRLFNISGVVYREMKLSDKLPGMSKEEALKLLASNGKLVKRPFVLFEGGGLVGFKPDEWSDRF